MHENPGREVGMGNAVIAGEKTQEVKGKTDPVHVRDVGINRDERFVSAYPEIGGTAVLARTRYMSRKILRILEVIVEGLFTAKCDSCHYWKCCPAQREPRPEWPGKAQVSRNEKISLCPVFDWLGKIT